MDITEAKRALTRERPARRRLIQDANESLSLYTAGHDELLTLVNVWSPQEDSANFMARAEVTINNYRNFPKQIVAKYLEAIKRAGGITRECDDKQIQHYLDAVYKGYFWTDIAPYLFQLPEVWIQVANPEPNGDITTEQDQFDMQGNPYITIHYPQFIRNFETDRNGNILWVTLERPGFRLLSTGVATPVTYIDYYDSQEYVTFMRSEVGGKIDGGMTAHARHTQVTEPAPHGFDQVPFIRLAYQEDNSLAGNPKIGIARNADITRGAKGLLGWIAMIVEAGYIHLRLQLVGPQKSIDAIKEEGMGNSTMIPEDQGGLPVSQHPLRYLEKPKTEMDILDRIYTRRVQEIFEDARLRDPSVRTVQSGVAKLLDMVPDIGVNSENSEWLMACDEKIIQLFCIAAKKPKAKVTIKYPKTFDVKSVFEKQKDTADGTAAMKNGGLPRSQTADTQLSEQIYSNLLEATDEQKLNTIRTELAEDAARIVAARAAQPAPGTLPGSAPFVPPDRPSDSDEPAD